MKKQIITFIFFLFAPLFLLFGKEGISYSTIEISPSESEKVFGAQTAHLIEIDPLLYEIKLVKASDTLLSRSSVLTIAKKNNAIAAINGGFFQIGSIFDGRSAGALKIKEWMTLPTKPRGCVGWSEDGSSFSFDRLLVSLKCNESFPVLLNTSRKKGDAVLFTPFFHATTLTSFDGEEILIKEGVVQAIFQNRGNHTIPQGGLILSLQQEHPLHGTFEVGEPISFAFNIISQTGFTTDETWQNYPYILGGTPLLLYDSQEILDFLPELTIPTFLSNRHSRTAVGLLPNGHLLFVVVDKTGLFDGLTMVELRNLMKDLGCTFALNLDGGGSSTMVFEDTIKNTPHGDEDEDFGSKKVRKVSDALIVLEKGSN